MMRTVSYRIDCSIIVMPFKFIRNNTIQYITQIMYIRKYKLTKYIYIIEYIPHNTIQYNILHIISYVIEHMLHQYNTMYGITSIPQYIICWKETHHMSFTNNINHINNKH